LKKADIGIAMGERGTQVAREAAEVVLKDDRFETIVTAIMQGRIIFDNIRKFVVYLLSCNISEVFIVGVASLFSSTLPITPLQILFLNLVTDVFPALALGMGKGDDSYLERPPRSSGERILEKSHWVGILIFGALITAPVLFIYYWSLFEWGQSQEKAVTLSFLTLGFAQVFHVFNLRKNGAHLFRNDITNNPFVWAAIVLCGLLLILSTEWRVLGSALDLVSLTPKEWLIVFLGSLFPLFGRLIARFD